MECLTGFSNRELCAVNAKEKLVVWRQFKDAVISDNPVTFTENNHDDLYLLER